MEHQDHQPPPQPQRMMKPPENHHPQQPPPPQKCPRCESSNTKFCYYNNYSLTQPRYFCKACRRYWTHGGTLRNVPVGGGCRKSKRPKPSVASSSSAPSLPPPAYPGHILPGMDPGQGSGPGQGIRPLAAAMGSGGTFYSGGSFLSTLAGMQNLPPGGGAAVNMGGGNGQYEASLALLQGVMKPQQFQIQNEYFPTRPPMSWTQSFINRAPAATTSAAVGSEFWSGGGGSGSNQAGSSFNQNHWPENNNGFDASQNSGT